SSRNSRSPQPTLTLLHPLPNLRRAPITPCGLTENAACNRIASLRDSAGPDRSAARVFPRRKTEISYELTWMREAREISYLSNYGRSDGWPHTSERLQSRGEVCPMRLVDEISD